MCGRPNQSLRGNLRGLSILIPALLLAAASAAPDVLALEASWLDGYKTKARLSAGVAGAEYGSRLFAFAEIELEEGWKTYWRNPGDAGGLPPAFDWSKSSNLAAAAVLYPAPKLMQDKSGNTIGYKDRVVFPVEIKPEAAGQPIKLALKLQYGICKDICVPVDAELALDVPANIAEAPPAAGLEALSHVPRGEGERRSGDPALKHAESRLDGDKPVIRLEADFGGETDGAAIFLEAPDGLYVPIPERTKDGGGGLLTFEADLSRDVDLEALKGKTLTATLAGKSGASVASIPIP